MPGLALFKKVKENKAEILFYSSFILIEVLSDCLNS